VLGILILTFIGMAMRGPYWYLYWPWEAWPDIPARI
jgi:cytochrome b-561